MEIDELQEEVKPEAVADPVDAAEIPVDDPKQPGTEPPKPGCGLPELIPIIGASVLWAGYDDAMESYVLILSDKDGRKHGLAFEVFSKLSDPDGFAKNFLSENLSRAQNIMSLADVMWPKEEQKNVEQSGSPEVAPTAVTGT